MRRKTERSRPRRGVSLVEVIMAMAALTIVMTLCAALLELLLRMNASGKAHVEAERAVSRAARAFRADVRAAGRVSRCAEGGESTSLALAVPGTGRVVEYQVLRDDLVRAEWSGGEVVSQERFRLPARSSARFSRRDEGGVRSVALVFDRRGRRTNGESTPRAFRVEATEGAGGRFAGLGEVTR